MCSWKINLFYYYYYIVIVNPNEINSKRENCTYTYHFQNFIRPQPNLMSCHIASARSEGKEEEADLLVLQEAYLFPMEQSLVIKAGLARMLKGGVIMVMNVEITSKPLRRILLT